MREQIPNEIKSGVNAERLDDFRLAVATVATRTWQDPGALVALRDEVSADKDGFLGFAGLDEETTEQAFSCGQHVATGTCRLLDITVRKIGSMPAYTTTDATIELFKATTTPPPVKDPLDYYGIDNTALVIKGDNTIESRMIEKPPAPTPEEALRKVLEYVIDRVRQNRRRRY